MNAGQRKYLQDIIDARPAGVRQLFADRGIHADPTPELMVSAYEVFGKPFVGDLVNVVFQPAASAEGATLEAAVSEGEQKKNLWENLTGVLNGMANVLTGYGVAFGKGSQASVTQTPIVVQTPEQKGNTMLYLGFALLVVIVLVAIILIKKKS